MTPDEIMIRIARVMGHLGMPCKVLKTNLLQIGRYCYQFTPTMLDRHSVTGMSQIEGLNLTRYDAHRPNDFFFEIGKADTWGIASMIVVRDYWQMKTHEAIRIEREARNGKKTATKQVPDGR